MPKRSTTPVVALDAPPLKPSARHEDRFQTLEQCERVVVAVRKLEGLFGEPETYFSRLLEYLTRSVWSQGRGFALAVETLREALASPQSMIEGETFVSRAHRLVASSAQSFDDALTVFYQELRQLHKVEFREELQRVPPGLVAAATDLLRLFGHEVTDMEVREPTKVLRPTDPMRYASGMPDTNKNSGKNAPRIAAAGQVVTKRRPPSHQPGYPRKDRENRVGLLVQLPPDVRATLHDAAKSSGSKSTQQFVTQVLEQVAAVYLANPMPTAPSLPVAVTEAVKRHRATAEQAAQLLSAALR